MRTPCLAAGAAALIASRAAAVASNAPPPLDAVRVDPSSGHFLDEHGRVRIFHGVNVVYKQCPWFPPSGAFNGSDSLDNQTMDMLRDWGFNVVRLGVMWPGVEPEYKQVDRSYLQEIERLGRELALRGVYTLVDLHQDVGSRRFCGEGFPEHYVDRLLSDPDSPLSRAGAFPRPLKFSLALNATSGYPLLEECLRHPFAEYYAAGQVGALWSELYRPGSELHEGFLRFWSVVAETFRQNSSHVLAYELLNEPSGYCLGGTPESCVDHMPVVSNWVEDKVLTPLYRAAAVAIRQHDAAKPILYEATTLPKLPGLPVFSDLPLGNDTQQGLAYHIYCQPGDGDSVVSGLVCEAAQDLYTSEYFDYLRTAKRVAGFLTEFGAILGTPGELEHLSRLLAIADAGLQSWAYWSLKKFHDFTTANPEESMFDPSGKPYVEKLKALSRTYAQAIGGQPTSMFFDTETAAFKLEFNATVASAPTEIYMNRQLHYPNGYSVQVEPAGCLSQESGEYGLLKLFLAEPSCRGSLVQVSIIANPAAEGPVGIIV